MARQLPYDFVGLAFMTPGGEQPGAGELVLVEQAGQLLGNLPAQVREEGQVGAPGVAGAGVRGHRECGESGGAR
ncbi:hypothetical protein [Streptomyces sp. NPDC055006]